MVKAYLYYSITNITNKTKIHKLYLSIENFYVITDLKTRKTIITYNENNVPQPAYSIEYKTYERLLINSGCVIP